MKKKRFLAGLIAAALLWTLSLPAAASGSMAEYHEKISFQELRSSLSFDLSEFETLASRIEKETLLPGKTSAVKEDLASLREMYLNLLTLIEIDNIDTSRDVYDAEADAAYAYDLDEEQTVEERFSGVLDTVNASFCSAAIDWEDAVYSSLYGLSDGYTEEEQTLYQEETALINEYYEAIGSVSSVEYGGLSYDYDSAYQAYLDWEIEYDTYLEIYQALCKAENDAAAGYYIELVENRKAQAALYGYSSLEEYYNDSTYFRDFTTEERDAFYEAVIRQIVPVSAALEDAVYDAWDEDVVDAGFEESTLLETVRNTISDISDTMLPAFDYMTEYGYYDISDSEDKADGAFTTLLYSPNAPYLLIEPTDSGYDYTTLIHEFGHYNAYYCSSDPMCTNIDLAEIHSQALELLALDSYETVFGAEAEYQRLSTLSDMLTGIIDGCLYDELERWAFAQDTLTVDGMNQKYMELLKKYGYYEADDPETEAYDWVEVGHLFAYPQYYISYAVSAAAALDIYMMSLSDRDEAIDTYLNLVACGESGDFLETLNEVGMDNPMTETALHAIAAGVLEAEGLSADLPEVQESGTEAAAQSASGHYEGPEDHHDGGDPGSAPRQDGGEALPPDEYGGYEAEAPERSVSEEDDLPEEEAGSGFSLFRIGVGVIVIVLIVRTVTRKKDKKEEW